MTEGERGAKVGATADPPAVDRQGGKTRQRWEVQPPDVKRQRAGPTSSADLSPSNSSLRKTHSTILPSDKFWLIMMCCVRNLPHRGLA